MSRRNSFGGKIFGFVLTLLIVAGPLLLASCQPKVCPANNKAQFNRKRARYAMSNHMKRKAGKGQKHRESKHRRPKYKFFQTKLKKRQFKHQTK